MPPLAGLETLEGVFAPHGLRRGPKDVAAYAACSDTKSIKLAVMGFARAQANASFGPTFELGRYLNFFGLD
jgi:hypothetical protein